MAIRHMYTVLCDYLVLGQDSKPTAVAIFQNVAVRQFPAAKDPLGILVSLRGDPGDPFEVVLVGPTGDTLGEVAKGTIQQPSDLREHQQWAMNVVGVASPAVFAKPGVYSVQVTSDGEHVHSYPFGVFARDQEEDDGVPAAIQDE
jgi:hypothetical protein